MLKFNSIVRSILLISFGWMILSCNGKIVESDTFHPMTIEKDLTTMDLETIRHNVNLQIDYRKNNNPRDILMLTSDWWKIDGYHNIDAVHSGRDDDFWMKLESNYTYQLGSGKEIVETGTCHYDDQKGSLLLLPKNKNKQPKVYEVRYGGDQIVLFGTQTYGINNGMQIKLVLRDPNPLLS